MEHLEYICSPERLIDQLEEVKRLLETHNPSENLFKSVMNKRKRNEFYSELCRRIDLIKSCKTIYAEEFVKYYSEAMDLIRNITELL